MNEIEEQWERLRLTEYEALTIELGDNISEDLNFKGERSLGGNVWMERSISQALIESTMAKMWRISKRAKFQEVGMNTFVMIFANQADKQRILDGRPWLFEIQLFVILQFDGYTPSQRMNFKRERFWV